MMQEVSEAMIRELLAEDARAPATLVTFSAEGLDDPIYATDAEAGITSRGIDYRFFPFAFTAGGASSEEPARTAKLEIANTDEMIVRALRTVTGVPTMTVELVRVFDPDYVEIAFRDLDVIDIQDDGPSVTFTLSGKSLVNAFAVAKRYVAARTPSLF